mmetsp:Transcript_5026/g.8191  ORF Transcript_5026/g.8191 Transcript_5026/m.8191 type:complete len:96 (+) Transcript_5026:2115-2402(+)
MIMKLQHCCVMEKSLNLQFFINVLLIFFIFIPTSPVLAHINQRKPNQRMAVDEEFYNDNLLIIIITLVLLRAVFIRRCSRSSLPSSFFSGELWIS